MCKLEKKSSLSSLFPFGVNLSYWWKVIGVTAPISILFSPCFCFIIIINCFFHISTYSPRSGSTSQMSLSYICAALFSWYGIDDETLKARHGRRSSLLAAAAAGSGRWCSWYQYLPLPPLFPSRHTSLSASLFRSPKKG